MKRLNLFKTIKQPIQQIKQTLKKQITYWLPVYRKFRATREIQKKLNVESVYPKTAEDMYNTWGIEGEKELRDVIRGLTIEKWIFIAIALTPFGFFIFYDYKIALPYLLMMPLFGIASLTKEWRLTCLKNGVFIPFKQWVLKGCH